jgi:hypothetical protein
VWKRRRKRIDRVDPLRATCHDVLNEVCLMNLYRTNQSRGDSLNMALAYRSKHNPWIIAVTVTLATIMEVLDTSIANVALPHIAGWLGASQDQST